MGYIKCERCGIRYADSYDTCPACADEQERSENKGSRRGPGRRLEHRRRSPKIVGPALIVVVLAVLAVVAYAFFGDSITKMLRGEQGEESLPSTDIVSVQPAAARLAAGELLALSADGARAYSWSSSNEKVATVDETGNVTAVAPGTAVITVTDAAGTSFAECVVTVEDPDGSDRETPDSGEGDETPVELSKKLKISTIFGELAQLDDGKFDVTMKPTESFALQVMGVSGDAVWKSNRTDVVTVDGDGTLHPVAPGEAEVTVTVNGHTAICIVRVSW